MRAKNSQAFILGAWVLAAATVAGAGLGCSSSNNTGPDGGGGHAGGGGGSGGGQAGNGGQGGQGGGGGGGGDATGGGAAFMAFTPCASQSDYVSNTTTVAFGDTVGFVYSPACLKIATGTQVTFSGDFGTHPLAPSTSRGMPTTNPIIATATGTTMSFTFNTPGFYGYYCVEHGTDQGDGMAGVIWVQ